MIEPPPAMVKSIMAAYETDMKSRGRKKKPTSYDIPVDLAGWKYVKRYGDLVAMARRRMQPVYDEEVSVIEKSIKSPVIREEMKKAAFAHTLRRVAMVRVWFSPCLDVPASYLVNLNSISVSTRKIWRPVMVLTIEHELVHFAQHYLAMALLGHHEAHPRVGLPPRRARTPNFNQMDDDIGAQQGVSKHYFLDDSEFYPNLRAIVRTARHRAKTIMARVPAFLRQLMPNEDREFKRKTFVQVFNEYSTSPFLEQLREHAPSKYRHALVVLYKGLSK